jgi:hypothetical protein
VTRSLGSFVFVIVFASLSCRSDAEGLQLPGSEGIAGDDGGVGGSGGREAGKGGNTGKGGKDGKGGSPAQGGMMTAMGGASGGAMATGGAPAGGGTTGTDAPVAIDAPPDRPVLPDLPPPRKSNGETCTRNTECMSDVCADGFCCATVCQKTCFACANSQTGAPNGVCAAAVGKTCGSECGVSMGDPAVFARVCNARGDCGPSSQVVERCARSNNNECVKTSCDNMNGGRCVTVSACGPGECCCARNGAKKCSPTNACGGLNEMCVQP